MTIFNFPLSQLTCLIFTNSCFLFFFVNAKPLPKCLLIFSRLRHYTLLINAIDLWIEFHCIKTTWFPWLLCCPFWCLCPLDRSAVTLSRGFWQQSLNEHPHFGLLAHVPFCPYLLLPPRAEGGCMFLCPRLVGCWVALVVTKLPQPSAGTEVGSSPLLPNSGSQSQAHPYWTLPLACPSSPVQFGYMDSEVFE